MEESITRRAIRQETERRGWKFEDFFSDESYYKITRPDGEWRIGRGSRLGFSNASGVFIAKNKVRSYEFVESLGYSVLPYILTRSLEEAEAFMRHHGPVVVKPIGLEQSKGVSVDIKTEEDLKNGFQKAKQLSGDKEVVVQTMMEGDLYRVLIVGNRLVAASRRVHAQVRGDGVHTVRQLVAIENKARSQTDTYLKPISEEDAESFLGATMDSVVASDTFVRVGTMASVSRGGSAYDATKDVTPALENVLTDITRALGLSVCGFDLITPDIGTYSAKDLLPLVELNSLPGLRLHLIQSESSAVNPAEAIIDWAFEY